MKRTLLLLMILIQMLSCVARGGDNMKEVISEDTYTDESKTPEEMYEMGMMYYTGINNTTVDNKKALTLITNAAKKDYFMAQIQLAFMYEYGLPPVSKDIKQAKNWYDTASRTLESRAKTADELYEVGMLSYGRNAYGKRNEYLNTDTKRAFNIIMKAAEQGSIKALLELGKIYCYGLPPVSKDSDKGERYYKSAFIEYEAMAAKNDPEAIYNLASMYDSATSRDYNLSKALEIYTKAAELGYPPAQFKVGYIHKQSGKLENHEKSLYWLKKAAENGYSKAFYELSNIYYKNKNDKEEYVRWQEMGAKTGDADLQYDVGVMYKLNVYVKPDADKARKWLLASSLQGNKHAQYHLALLLISNNEYEEAFKWLNLSAMQDHINSKSRLGDLYYWGDGVKQDYSKAIVYYQHAGEDGDMKSALQVAAMYRKGEGVKKSIYKSLQWQNKADKIAHPNVPFLLRYFTY